jgi:hypothetical protein
MIHVPGVCRAKIFVRLWMQYKIEMILVTVHNVAAPHPKISAAGTNNHNAA